MKNLLKSDFYRLFKSKSFYICALIAVFLFGLNIFMMKWSYKMMAEQGNMDLTLPYKDGISYGLTAFSDGNIMMIIAIFSAIFVTAEFAHGTMKNAVSKGFPKLEIYLSKLATVTAAAFLIILISMITGTIFASILLGGIGSFTGDFIIVLLKYIGIELFLNFAFAAVLVLVAMVVKNLGGVIAIDIIGVMSFIPLIFSALEYLVKGKIKFTEFSLFNNMSLYTMNQIVTGSDYLRSVIVGMTFLVIASGLGILAFRKADVK